MLDQLHSPVHVSQGSCVRPDVSASRALAPFPCWSQSSNVCCQVTSPQQASLAEECGAPELFLQLAWRWNPKQTGNLMLQGARPTLYLHSACVATKQATSSCSGGQRLTVRTPCQCAGGWASPVYGSFDVWNVQIEAVLLLTVLPKKQYLPLGLCNGKKRSLASPCS